MNARSRLSNVSAASSSFKHILYSSLAGAFTKYITRAPIGSISPDGTVAQRFGRDLLVVVLHLLANSSCRREVGASWTYVVTLYACRNWVVIRLLTGCMRPRLCVHPSVREMCYTEKATPARHRPERQHNALSNRRKQCNPNETKPYTKPTLPRKRQTTPTNGHTPRRLKPTHTRLTYTRMRPHAPSHQAGDHPVPAHTERHNPPKLRTQ